MLAISISSEGVRVTVDDNITDVELVEEINAISKLSFTVYPNSNAYDLVGPSITHIVAYDTFLNKVIFEGRVYSADDTMDGDGVIAKKLVCEGVLSYLCDSIVSNVTFSGPDDTDILGDKAKNAIIWLINKHNELTSSEEKHIYIGNIKDNVYLKETISIDNDNIYNVLTQVINSLKWEFKVRYYEGRWYLDAGPDFNTEGTADGYSLESSTMIISGVNMVSISKKVSTEDVCTAIMPMGGVGYVAPAYRENITPVRNQGQTEWAEQARLTLHHYDNEESPHPRIFCDKYLINEELYKKYGFIAKTVIYDNLVAHDDNDFMTVLNRLYDKGIREVDNLKEPEESYETNAVDLARAGYNFDSIMLGYYYRVQNPMMNIDTVLRVTSKTLKYEDPVNCTLKFGKSGVSMSNASAKANVSLSQKYSANAFNAAKSTNYRMGGMSMRNLTQNEYNAMGTHLDDTIYYVSSGSGVTKEIKMYKGDEEISTGGGVENAAIVTNAQASQLITEEEIIFVDSSIPARVVWGRRGNWFYNNGYAYFFTTEEELSTLGNTFLEDYGEPFFPCEIWGYEYINKSTYYKDKIYMDIVSISMVYDGGVQKRRIEIAVYCDQYRMTNGEWTYYNTRTMRRTPNNYIYIYLGTDEQLEKIGLLPVGYNLNFETGVNTTNIMFYVVYKLTTSSYYKFTNRMIYVSDPYRFKFLSNAEIIFAKGMTSTTMEVDE